MIYTQKIKNAIKFAIKTHDVYQKQTRKGKEIAYITHPLTVGIILAKAGASEEVICAGILHDTIEDSVNEKKVSVEMLDERFGQKVAALVLNVTEQDKKLAWEQRKIQALEHIKSFSDDSLLVKSADIISNMSELLDDYARHGEDVFQRFGAPKEKVLLYQLKTINKIIMQWSENPLVADLQNLTENLEKISN
jgi:(p)ppGpp synthase/HD superfamily hydrolase